MFFATFDFLKFFIEKECDAEFAQMLYEKAPRVLDDLYREYQKENDTTGESYISYTAILPKSLNFDRWDFFQSAEKS